MSVTGRDIDMSRELSARDNLRKSKIITLGSTFLAALIFLVVFIVTDNYWILALTFIMILSGAFFLYFVNKFEQKYFNNIDDDEN